MKTKITIRRKSNDGILATDLEKGEYGVVVEGVSSYGGHIIARTFEGGFVDLQRPRSTWNSDCSLRVKKVVIEEIIAREI